MVVIFFNKMWQRMNTFSENAVSVHKVCTSLVATVLFKNKRNAEKWAAHCSHWNINLELINTTLYFRLRIRYKDSLDLLLLWRKIFISPLNPLINPKYFSQGLSN